MINIAGLEKAAVLKALYDNSQPLGMGFIHYDPKPMSLEEARAFLAKSTYFDYLKGRVMKSELSKNDYYEGLYDRDNGPGAALRALTPLIEQSKELSA